MKSLFFIFILSSLFFNISTYGQENTPCEQIIKEISSLPTQEEKLNQITKELRKSELDLECQYKFWVKKSQIFNTQFQFDSTLVSMDKAILTANKLHSTPLFLEIALKKVFLNIETNKTKEAFEILKTCRKKLNEQPASDYWIGYYNKLSIISRNKGEYTKSIKYADSGIAMAKKYNKIKFLHEGYLDKATSLVTTADYQKAIITIQKAISIIEKIEDKTELSFAYISKAVCYERLEDYREAVKVLKLAVKSARKTNEMQRISRAYSRMSISLIKLKETEEALRVIDSVISISERVKDYSTLAIGYSDKGNALSTLLNDYDSAERAYLKSNQILEKKDVTTRAKKIFGLSNISGLIAVNEKKKNYKNMYLYIKQYEKESEVFDELVGKINVANYYKLYYEGINNYKNAYQYYKQEIQFKDSLSNKEVRVEVADLEKKYETQKKEIEILTLHKEKQEQKIIAQKAETKQYISFGIALLAILLLLIGLWIFTKIKKQQKALNLAHSELKHSHNEVASINNVKDRLFSIIAHDLRNMLVPFQRGGKLLNHYVSKNDYDMVLKLAGNMQENSRNLSHMLDNLLNWSLEQMNGYSFKAENLTISKELEEITNLFKSYAKEKNTLIEIKGKDDLIIAFDKGAFHVIFRNLLGNALKYTEDGKVIINFMKQENFISFEIIDTGIGMNHEKLTNLFKLGKQSKTGTKGEKGTGIGLNLVYRFIKNHQGEITVSSEERIGTKFEIKLPVIKSLGNANPLLSKNISA